MPPLLDLDPLAEAHRPRAFINGFALIIAAVINNWRYIVNAVFTGNRIILRRIHVSRILYTPAISRNVRKKINRDIRGCVREDGKRIKLSFLKTHGTGTRALLFFPSPGLVNCTEQRMGRGGREWPVSLVGQSN